MRAVALSVLGLGADAEDAVQDAMLVALSKISELRDPASAATWLRVIVRNCCLMRLRARREVLLPGNLPLVAGELTPEETMERNALRDWIWHAIEELSPPLRQVITLRYFSGIPAYEDIAAACDIPVGTVRSRLNQARAKLAAALEATASCAHADAGKLTADRHAEGVELLEAAERGQFGAALAGRWAPDLQYITGTGERGTRNRLIRALNNDIADNVHEKLATTVASSDLTIWDMTIINPPEDPRHCPPAVTWLMTLHGGRVRRLRLFHPKPELLKAA
jgi:RNA polymerase sigma factor (sigma-70 family)